MASDQSYLDFILEQLSALDGITSRAMMGEYILYYHGKIFGGIYDNRLLIKPTKTAKRLMPDAARELPYEGGKAMLLMDRVDDGAFLCRLVSEMESDLPAPKRK